MRHNQWCYSPSRRLTVVPPMSAVAESVVYFPTPEYRVEESAGTLQVAVERAGDLSQELTVLCVTRNGENATGTML